MNETKAMAMVRDGWAVPKANKTTAEATCASVGLSA